MFIIEGMDRVREIIKKNRERKLTQHKKLSNNSIIEIDHCSPIELLNLQVQLMKISKADEIFFVNEKGHRKSELQKLNEEIEECRQRLMKYKDSFEIMGTERHSYSKTDIEATLMRMKDDHM